LTLIPEKTAVIHKLMGKMYRRSHMVTKLIPAMINNSIGIGYYP